MNRLKVLHSCPVWLPTTQTWLYNQITSLPSSIQNSVACIGTNKTELFAFNDVHSFCGASTIRYKLEAGLRKLGCPRYPFWLQALAKRKNISLIHSHFGNMGWLDRTVSKKLHIPHVVTFYGLDVDHLPQQDQRWIKRYTQLFESVDTILCEGSHMAARIVGKGCPAKKVRVHHLGIDLQAIPFKPRVRNEGEPFKVLIAGAFREKKGICYALDALGELQKTVALEISLIGDADADKRSQEEKSLIFAMIAKHNLSSKVRMLGYCSHIKLLEEAYRHHVFLSPSVHAKDGDSEGGAPVSIIEMAASGMPVVSSMHCDIPEVLEHGISGLLAPERDVNMLIMHLSWLAAHPHQWYRFSKAARVRIEAEYDKSVQAEKLAEIYQELCARNA